MKTALLIASLVFVSPASAMETCCWQYDNAKPAPVIKHHVSQPKKTKTTKPKRKKTYAKKAAPKSSGTAVMAAEYRAEEVTHCVRPVKVVGSQDVRETAAEDSAKKAWAEEVRWAHGEAFMDIQNAKDYASRCSRSSIGEIAGQTFSRCEIVATPCRPGMVKGATR